MNDKIHELEVLCRNHVEKLEEQHELISKLEVSVTRTKIELGRTGKELKKLQFKNDSKDKLIKEFEELIEQLTDSINRDKVIIAQ